jgi:hypothetical protein
MWLYGIHHVYGIPSFTRRTMERDISKHDDLTQEDTRCRYWVCAFLFFSSLCLSSRPRPSSSLAVSSDLRGPLELNMWENCYFGAARRKGLSAFMLPQPDIVTMSHLLQCSAPVALRARRGSFAVLRCEPVIDIV